MYLWIATCFCGNKKHLAKNTLFEAMFGREGEFDQVVLYEVKHYANPSHAE